MREHDTEEVDSVNRENRKNHSLSRSSCRLTVGMMMMEK